MHILVIGSTGGTGQQLVQQGLDKGYQVTAFARNPDDVTIQHSNLTVVKGDVLDYDSVDAAVQGKDAVLSALGTRSLKKSTIVSEGTKNIIRAMETHGVKRFVCETSIGLGDSKGQLGFWYDMFVIPLILGNVLKDKAVQEYLIMESKLDWVIVRPGGLTDGERTGQYYAWSGKRTRTITGMIARADVADYMLKQVEDNAHLGKAMNMSY